MKILNVLYKICIVLLLYTKLAVSIFVYIRVVVIKNIDIQLYKRGKRGRYAYDQSVLTDSDGQFVINKPSSSYYIHAKSSKTGNIVFHDPVRKGYKSKKYINTSVSFYTDRAIYRPGQLIKFKGVCLRRDPNQDSYEAYSCKKVKVSFKDANYQEIATKSFDANDYGSFSGEFTAPHSGLLGNMQLVARGPNGSKSIRVEEYKRPKFEISLHKPKKQMRLNTMVIMKGEAKTYSGVALSKARVKYRVYRSVNYPYWWRHSRLYSAAQQISHGKVFTNQDGKFEIEFFAKRYVEAKKI